MSLPRTQQQSLTYPRSNDRAIDEEGRRFRFLELPAELRNCVYKLVNKSELRHVSTIKTKSASCKTLFGLTQSCQQIRLETRPMYLRTQLVTVDFTKLSDYLSAFYVSPDDTENPPIELAIVMRATYTSCPDFNERFEDDTDILPILLMRAHCKALTPTVSLGQHDWGRSWIQQEQEALFLEELLTFSGEQWLSDLQKGHISHVTVRRDWDSTMHVNIRFARGVGPHNSDNGNKAADRHRYLEECGLSAFKTLSFSRSTIIFHVGVTGSFENRRLSCLVISPPGRLLRKFTSNREFLEACHDFIRAHRSLYKDGNILHRDISAPNIIIPHFQ